MIGMLWDAMCGGKVLHDDHMPATDCIRVQIIHFRFLNGEFGMNDPVIMELAVCFEGTVRTGGIDRLDDHGGVRRVTLDTNQGHSINYTPREGGLDQLCVAILDMPPKCLPEQTKFRLKGLHCRLRNVFGTFGQE